jgi:lysophospholipase L1-like esterase
MKKLSYFLITLFVALIPFCKNLGQNTVNILALGNSITYGYTDGSLSNDMSRGYRYTLKYLLQQAGYNVDFVGHVSSGCLYFGDCQHAGVLGTQDQYVARLLLDGYDEKNDQQIIVPTGPYLDVYKPDIILLHIGTNDVTHEADPTADQRVSQILNLIDQYEIRAQKEVIVFLALIINRKLPWEAGSGAATTSLFNDYIKNIAQNRIANGDKIVIVDMEHDAGFLYNDEDMADQLHPNTTGYNKMANLWFSSIANNYNTAPVISSIPNQSVEEDHNFSTISLNDYVSDIESGDASIVWNIQQLNTNNLNIVKDANNQVTLTVKNASWSGTQRVVFTATDAGNNGKYIKCDSDTADFTVVAVNDPPLITSTPSNTVYVGSAYSYELTATDVDNPTLTLSALILPGWLGFNPSTGLLSGTPLDANKGLNNVTLRVSDGSNNIDQHFTITVNGLSGIEDLSENAIGISPVPTQDYLRIDFHNKLIENAQLTILSSLGSSIFKTIVSAGQNDFILDTSKYKEGMYFILITNSTIDYASKFLIIK